MIVWLASYPRSGNTFARLVLQQLYDIELPTAYLPNADGAAPVRKRMFPELDCRITLDAARSAPQPMIVKTHDLPSDDAPAIYLVRDGRDAIVSHAHYVLDFDLQLDSTNRQEFHDQLRKLIETDNWFGGWGGNVLAWTSRTAPTAVMRFEDLIAAPTKSIRAAVAELGLPLAERRNYEIPQFSELHGRAPNFFRRGGIGNWRDEMPHELHELFWQHYGAAMDELGFKRGGEPLAPPHRSTSAA